MSIFSVEIDGRDNQIPRNTNPDDFTTQACDVIYHVTGWFGSRKRANGLPSNTLVLTGLSAAPFHAFFSGLRHTL
jgi:hypothetical protein